MCGNCSHPWNPKSSFSKSDMVKAKSKKEEFICESCFTNINDIVSARYASSGSTLSGKNDAVRLRGISGSCKSTPGNAASSSSLPSRGSSFGKCALYESFSSGGLTKRILFAFINIGSLEEVVAKPVATVSSNTTGNQPKVTGMIDLSYLSDLGKMH